MTTHAAILEQLEKYEGGMFLPQLDEFVLRPNKYTRQPEWSWKDNYSHKIEHDHIHDSAHIERAAFRAVMEYCKERGFLLCVHECDGQYWCKALDGDKLFYISHGPDEPAMWLAAVKYINGGRG